MKKFISLLSAGVLFIFLFLFALPVSASGVNFGYNNEIYHGLAYYTYVQFQPSYKDNGNHAAQAYFYYKNTQDNSRHWSECGKSKHDGHVYSLKDVIWDDPNPVAPKAQFYYNFVWVSDSSSYWPY